MLTLQFTTLSVITIPCVLRVSSVTSDVTITVIFEHRKHLKNLTISAILDYHNIL